MFAFIGGVPRNPCLCEYMYNLIPKLTQAVAENIELVVIIFKSILSLLNSGWFVILLGFPNAVH